MPTFCLLFAPRGFRANVQRTLKLNSAWMCSLQLLGSGLYTDAHNLHTVVKEMGFFLTFVQAQNKGIFTLRPPRDELYTAQPGPMQCKCNIPIKLYSSVRSSVKLLGEASNIAPKPKPLHLWLLLIHQSAANSKQTKRALLEINLLEKCLSQ